MGKRRQAAAGPTESQFIDTGKTINLLLGDAVAKRPVLMYNNRLYAGTMLSMLNPYGYGGPVWSARTLEQLEYNANFGRGKSGNGH
jgi:hypothetical protein